MILPAFSNPFDRRGCLEERMSEVVPPQRRPTMRLLLLLFVAAPALAQSRPPESPRGRDADVLFGTRIPDPYRWLEAYSLPPVRAWFEAEDAIAKTVLESQPAYAAFASRFAQARQARPYSLGQTLERHGRLFYFKRMPDEQGPALYVRDLFSEERRLLSVDQIEGERDAVLGRFHVSPTGAHVAAGYTSGGNERGGFVLVETASGRPLAADMPARVAGLDWLPDGRSFVYNTYRDLGPDATPGALYGGLPARRHVLGTDVATDAVVFDPTLVTGDSSALGGPSVDEHAGLAFVSVFRDGVSRTEETYVSTAEAVEQGAPITWRRVSSLADSVRGVGARGPWLYADAFKGAPHGRLVRLPFPPGLLAGTEAPDWSKAEVLLETEGLDFWNGSPSYASDAVYWLETKEGQTRLFRFPYGGGAREEVPPPFEGSYGGLSALSTRPGVTFVYGGWTQGDRRFRYDPSTRRIDEEPPFYNPPDPFDHLDGLTAETVMVPSHDGVRVPLTILRVAGASGPRPTILNGYAAYGTTDDAYFRPGIRPWLEAGGAYAICHARGGGYSGSVWRDAGRKASKPNTWKDAIACAEHLVRAGLTRPEMLGINGTSAGGIFAGRALTERPDLFGASAIEVGVADMVRFEKSSVGPGNRDEFGSVETEAGFRALLAMSPYHHVQVGGRYPATLLYAGFNDTRVPPWHPGKLAAALRHAGGPAAQPGGARPVLLRVDFGGGHGLEGSTVASGEVRAASVFAFFAWRLGLDVR